MMRRWVNRFWAAYDLHFGTHPLYRVQWPTRVPRPRIFVSRDTTLSQLRDLRLGVVRPSLACRVRGWCRLHLAMHYDSLRQDGASVVGAALIVLWRVSSENFRRTTAV